MSDGKEYTLCSCGKRCLSYREARQTIADAKRTNQINHHKHIPKREYKCELCGMYHLSSDSR